MARIVHVEGLKELDAALSALPKATGKAVLRRVAKMALQPMDKAWRQLAPRLTGSLEESGGVGTKLTRRQARLNKKRDDRSSIEMFTGPNDPAAIPQEFGTFDQPAEPFMRPAWGATQDEILGIVKDQLGTEIAKAAARVAKKQARAGV